MSNSGINKKDCGVVDKTAMLGKFRKWKVNYDQPLPFYIHTAHGGAAILDGEPELIRNLLRIYNTQKLFLNVGFVPFLNSEGIAARKVSIDEEEVLGYNVEIFDN
jgi:hypothetical protein